MKQFLILLFLSLQGLLLFPQTNSNQAIVQQAVPNTYAVVVGISKYENKGIEQLEFADKDAEIFAGYLRSKSGGNVPEDHIRLLQNENATYAAIYDAMYWLLETCQKDDVVYFYFSGHGDMENNTIYNLGFLLSYNTPRTNYINNSVRIEDLNNIANTLSVKSKAKVILITDACHSGKLAGNDYKGTFLVGDQLRTVKNNEIRITSCATDELSAEDGGWGGGRGVFSYYLVNGLKGLADTQHDGIVTLGEIRNYLDSSLASDVLLIQKKHKQTPVIKGKDDFKIATTDKNALSSLVLQSAAPVVGSTLKALAKQPQAYFFEAIDTLNPEDVFDFNRIDQLPVSEITNAFIAGLPDSMLNNEQKEKLIQLRRTIAENKDALNRFNNKLVTLLSDRVQEVINLYLEGDAAELERRRYYNLKSGGYDVYPKMISVALKLTQPSNYLYHILEVKLHYFTGVALRLKIPTVEDPMPLLEQALQEQLKALALEENAAYIQNELGILYLSKRENDKAEKYFLRASEIAPEWAIPWANLTGMYAVAKRFDKATEVSEKAMALQPRLQISYINSGVLNERKGNLLAAEELFQRGIGINSRHYLPFERLGYIYMRTTQYAAADSFLYEADLRKKGFHFKALLPDVDVVVAGISVDLDPPCALDTAHLKKNDVIGHFIWGLQYMQAGKKDDAERIFKKVIEIDGSNPLVFYYLGKILFEKQRWEEAESIFKFAKEYYLEEEDFSHYCDSMAVYLTTPDPDSCILKKFKRNYYKSIENFYYLGKVYELWNHFNEAETEYKAIIKLAPEFMGGYHQLWNLLEKTGRYTEAEDVIQSYGFYDSNTASLELNGFYKRVTQKFPDDPNWHYKAGILLYEMAAKDPGGFLRDKMKVVPDTYGEKFENVKLPKNYSDAASFVSGGMHIPGPVHTIDLAAFVSKPRSNGISYLQKADSLLQDNDDMKADIHDKTGDLYVWMGLIEKASVYYKRSVDLRPDNATTRLKLIDAWSATWHYREALEQLDSLLARKEINLPKHIMLAKYCIHAGRFAQADTLLNTAEIVYPFFQPELYDLRGRMYLLSAKPKKAVPNYQAYLDEYPADASTIYTMAILYRQMGNKEKAWKYLETALSAGFNYYWVLKTDPNWNDVRNTSRWKALVGKVEGIKYPPPPELSKEVN